MGRPLAGVVQRDGDARAALDLRRVAAGLLGGLADPPVEGREAVGRVAVVVEPGVPGVGVGQRQAEHARPVRADHDRDPPRRRRQQHQVVDLGEAAVHADALAGQQPVHDLERLGEARHAAVVGQAERAELALVPAGAEAEHEAAAADVIDGGRHLRQQAGAVEGRAGHQRAERDPFGRRGKRRQHRPDLPGPALGAAVLGGVEQVIAEPDRVESDLLGGRRHGQILGPADDPLGLWELHSDTQWARHRATLTHRPSPP